MWSSRKLWKRQLFSSHFTDEETDLRLSSWLMFIPLVSEGPKTRDQNLLAAGPVLFPYPDALLMSFPIEVKS